MNFIHLYLNTICLQPIILLTSLQIGEELNFYLDLLQRTQVSVIKNNFVTFASVR